MRLIDAEDLEKTIKEFCKGLKNEEYHRDVLMTIVDEAPTIEAEPKKWGSGEKMKK